MPKIALLQMTSGIDPEANAARIVDAAEQAAGEGAEMLFTPEMAALLDSNRKRASQNIVEESDNPAVERVARAAGDSGIWISLGLPALRDDGRWANRTLLFDNKGEIAARYDKIHMFDVELDTSDRAKAEADLKAMCEKLLANTVIEDYAVEVE